MKIAIITPTFPPYAGGIGNVAAANARELTKLGHEVTVFTPQYEQVSEEIKDLNITRLPTVMSYGNAAFVPSLIWMLKGYDIAHIHYPFFGGAESLLFYKRTLKKKFGVKVILHYHMDVVGEGFLKTIFSLQRKFILPKIFKMADKVIFTSLDYGKNSYLKDFYKNHPEKFAEVPNGVDSRKFSPAEADEALLNKYDISKTDKIVLFVGGLDKAHYFKGVEYLIEAMSRLKNKNYDWKLVIVGSGDLSDQYQSFATQLRLQNKVIFTGYVSNKDLPKFYNLSDVVVLPSVDKSEAFGLALVEGMACAKAVVASDLPGVRSVVEDGKTGLTVKPENSDDLATKINYLLKNKDVSAVFGQAARKKVEEQYDWEKIGAALNKLYQKIKR